MTRRILTGVLLCFAVAIAQAKPNFSGTWSLNLTASDFGPMPNKPDKATTTIDHAEPNLLLTSDVTGPQGQRVIKFKYVTDGSEISNVNGPVELKSTAKWDGDVLVIESKGKLQDNEIKFIDKWSLSSDGKTARQARHIVVQQGEFDQTYVYDKK
jgi:hypothetical protein